MVGGMEKWEDGRWKRFNFLSYIFGWENGKVKKNRKSIGLVEKKNKRIKNEIGINLLLCPYYTI